MQKQIKTKPCENPNCNNLVYYKTKPPKFCKKCKSYKSNGSNSKIEVVVFNTLNTFIKAEYINNGYYSWLVSPKGAPLQIDRYYPDIKLAFEVQGIQHLQYVPYFHKTQAEFKYLQKCDSIKAQICAKRGITLIHIKYNETISKELILRKIYAKNKKLYDDLVRKGILNTAY